MTHGSLFSGIGGFDLPAEWMGWENMFHCEWESFCQRVLKYYWPNAKSYGDITKTDFTIWRGKVDILTGGFPCQPYSQAGKRKGKEDERHLWPEMLRAIREIQPRWIVGENVRGIINWNGGMVFDEVCSEMEAEGYQVQPFVLPACGVNAPHRRDRVWFVAHRRCITTRRTEESKQSPDNIAGCCGSEHTGIKKDSNQLRTTADPTIKGRKKRKQDGGREDEAEDRTGMDDRLERHGDEWTTSDTNNQGLQGREDRHKPKRGGQSNNKQFNRHNFILGQNWQIFPTQSPVCGRDDGLSSELDGITISKHRRESIKAYGNAIVPQVAYQIFNTIELWEQEQDKAQK